MAYSLSQKSFNAPLDEGEPQYGIDRGTIARVVLQTQVNESLEILAVARGDGWVRAPVGVGVVCGVVRVKGRSVSVEMLDTGY